MKRLDLSGLALGDLLVEVERRRVALLLEALRSSESTDRWVLVATCGYPIRSIRAAAKAGTLNLRRVGRADFVSRAELDRWIASQAPKAKAANDDPLAAAIASGKVRRIGGAR